MDKDANIIHYSHQANNNSRRGGRVDDCVGLENQCARKRTVGSNPTPSVDFHIRIPIMTAV